MKYLRILTLYSSDVFQQRARSFVWFLLSLIMPLVTLLFWQGAFANRPIIGGWTAPEMRSYYLLNVIAGSMLQAHIEIFVIYNQIKEGNIAGNLMRPFNYLWYILMLETPWRLIQGAFGFITFVIFLFFGLQIEFTHAVDHILLGLVISVSAFLLSYLLKMCVAMLAFWFTDLNALIETQDVLILILAGFIMPVDLLPWNLHTISLFTPFPYIIYYPIMAFIGKLPTANLLQILMIQWIWIFALYGLFRILWNRGVYKFSGVGQ